MKLYNTIIAFDMFVVAESPEAAREALRTWIAEGNAATEVTATETTREGTIRASWRDQRPLIAADVSDDDFEKLKGQTTAQIYDLLYKKAK